MPVTPSDIKITNMVPDTLLDANQQIIEAERIFYVIAEFGPYSVVIPKLETSAQQVLTRVRDDAMRRIEILNLQF